MSKNLSGFDLFREEKFLLSFECLFEVLKRGSFFKLVLTPKEVRGFFMPGNFPSKGTVSEKISSYHCISRDIPVIIGCACKSASAKLAFFHRNCRLPVHNGFPVAS